MHNSIVKNSQSWRFCKMTMFLLALFPLLHWYDIGLPLGLGDFLLLLVAILAIGMGRFQQKAYPKLFFLVWLYIAINWYHYNFYPDWKGILPGGIVFFIFALNVGVGITNFDINLLRKYMRWIVILAVVIFFFQFIVLHLNGKTFCFVPNLTGHFIYENYSYSELAAKHINGFKPCAFFIEKSYMAYYLVIYLCLELFQEKFKEFLFSKLSIIIIVTLVLLQSGSGVVGLTIPVVAKFLTYYWQKKKLRYIILLLSLLLFTFIFYLFVATDIGASMLSRQEELYTEGTSGFSRIMYGYMFYDNLDPIQKIIGTSVSNINNLTYLSYQDSKFPLNGIQSPLIQLGTIGLLLWIIFYVSVFFKTNACGRICVLVFFIFSAIEVTYLGSYMTILTIIPCSILYNKKEI